jgi:hypothetical protein
MKPRKIFDGRTKGLMTMLRTKGWTYQRIAEKFNCGRETARRYIKG